MSEAFKEMFFVVIQLGAILAVAIMFWRKMFPFQFRDKTQPIIKKETFSVWFKVVIAATLIFYGVAFIVIEIWNKKRLPIISKLEDMTYQTAFLIGLFQVLSIIPGTSRSGATIIGALMIGVSRVAAAEFTFFLAVPVMFGLSAIKIIKFGLLFTNAEQLILSVGMFVAFLVSLLVIKFLMSFIQKHAFRVFGWYRIALEITVLIVFVLYSPI